MYYKKRGEKNEGLVEQLSKLEKLVQSQGKVIDELKAQVQRQKAFDKDTCLSFRRVWSYMGELDQRTQAENNPAVLRTLSFDFVEQGAA